MKNILLILFSALAFGHVSAQTITVIGSPFEFKATSVPDVINVGLKLDKVNFADIQFLGKGRAFSVRNGSSAEEGYVNGLTYLAADNPAHLQLNIDPKLLDAQGNFDVNILYSIKGNPVQSYLTFVLTRSAATLTANKIEIKKEGFSTTHNQLCITETSGKAAVNDLFLAPPFIPSVKSGALITFDKPYDKNPVVIGGGKYAVVNFSVDPDVMSNLPLGETTAEVQFTSKGLTAPLKVQIDIWHKLSKWLIVLTVLIGLAVGNFVRHILQNQRDIEQARLNALQLAHDIKTYTVAIQDAGFQKDMTNIIGDLLTAVDGAARQTSASTAADINTIITKAKDDYTTKKAAFEALLKSTTDNFNNNATTLYEDYEDGLMIWLSDTKSCLDKAEARLNVSDVTGASAFLLQVNDLSKSAGINFLNYANSFVIFFGNKPGYIPTDALNKFGVNLPNLLTTLQNAITLAIPLAGSMHDNLQSLNNIQIQIETVAKYIQTDLSDYYTSTKPSILNDESFKTAFEQWSGGINVVANNPGKDFLAGFNWNSSWLSELDAAGKAALGIPEILGDDESGKKRNFVMNFVRNAIVGNFGNLMKPEPRKSTTIDDIDKTYQNVNSRYIFFAGFQTLALTLIIGLGAYLSYGPKFVGTWDEIISIFLVSFSLDITVDTVTQLKTKLPW